LQQQEVVPSDDTASDFKDTDATPLTKNSTLEKVLPDTTTTINNTETDENKQTSPPTNSSYEITTSGGNSDDDVDEDTKDSKSSKSSKKDQTPTVSPSPTTESKKSKKDSSPTSSPAPTTTESKQSKSSNSSKSSSKSSKSSSSSKSSKKGSETYTGDYSRLREYQKSCSSNSGCIKESNAFCMGGVDIVQEFEVEDLGTVVIHLDFAWDFAKAPSTCATVSRREETLLGIGWLPIMVANSYVCYSEYIYRIPGSPNLNEQTFAGRFEVELQGERYQGQILSGAVCELYSDSNVYLQTNSFAILAMIPGYSISLQYQLDERTMEVLEVLSGAPHISIMEDDSYGSGRWDHLRPETSIMQGQ
jgi:hypothetical protein